MRLEVDKVNAFFLSLNQVLILIVKPKQYAVSLISVGVTEIPSGPWQPASCPVANTAGSLHLFKILHED